MKYIFPIIVALSALSVSISAAYYSVFGLSRLFAGATTEVIVMAASLEVAKLVVASLLYRYWSSLNKLIRTYLLVACVTLILVTSMGIYGFLSGAFQETATQSKFLDQQVLIVEKKQEAFVETKNSLVLEKEQLNVTISDLRTSLSNPAQVSYYSEDAGQVITTTSTSTRKALQLELDKAIDERDVITQDIRSLSDSIATKDVEILEMQIGNESARELGPLKYVAELTGRPMEQIVNWFMLILIFVFDPLAVVMVIMANMAFLNLKKPEEQDVIEPKKVEVKIQKPEKTKVVEKVIVKGDNKLTNKRLSKIEAWLSKYTTQFVGKRNGFNPDKFDYGDKE